MKAGTTKKRVLSLLLCLCLCLGLLSNASLAASTVTVKVELTADYSSAYQELEYLNQIRREAGLNELAMDEGLMDMALLRAAECAVCFSHTRPTGENCDTARPSGSAKATDEWYNSPGHKANMLYGDFNSVGIACVQDLLGNTYWVQNFSSTTAVPESTPSSGSQRAIFSVQATADYLTPTLKQSSLSMDAGEEVQLYLYNDKSPLVPDILQSSDEGVARVSAENGGISVSAVGAGTATLTLGFGGQSTSNRGCDPARPAGAAGPGGARGWLHRGGGQNPPHHRPLLSQRSLLLPAAVGDVRPLGGQV